MSQTRSIGSVVQDERQLDGSRHVEIVADLQGGEAALYLVVNQDGALEEAELTLELDGQAQSVSFDPQRSTVDWNELEFQLAAARWELRATPRQDGDLDMLLLSNGEPR